MKTLILFCVVFVGVFAFSANLANGEKYSLEQLIRLSQYLHRPGGDFFYRGFNPRELARHMEVNYKNIAD